MRAASENGYQAGLEVLLDALRADADAMAVAENLFGVSDVLRESVRLPLSLTDPGRSVDEKRQLVHEFLEGGVQPQTVQVLQALVSHRWSAAEDLAVAIERLGNEAVFVAADRDGKLKEVEEELFAVHNFLVEQRDLRINLSDLGVGTAHDRAHFAARFFEGAINAYTSRLVRRSVRLSVHGRLLSYIRDLTEQAAKRRGRLFARVATASPLTDAQVERLQTILENKYKKPIALNVVVEPELLGGIHIQVDGDGINATVSANLAKAKRELVH